MIVIACLRQHLLDKNSVSLYSQRQNRAGNSITAVLWSCIISQCPPRLTTTKLRMYRPAPCFTPSGVMKGLMVLVTVPTATF
jgi:hypothetical protein